MAIHEFAYDLDRWNASTASVRRQFRYAVLLKAARKLSAGDTVDFAKAGNYLPQPRKRDGSTLEAEDVFIHWWNQTVSDANKEGGINRKGLRIEDAEDLAELQQLLRELGRLGRTTTPKQTLKDAIDALDF